MLTVLELKSFIFNIYHVVMTSIAWQIEFDKEEPQGAVGKDAVLSPPNATAEQ